ncbi:MAG: hypothetical protein ACT4N2_00735 [Hyphomicrobium sp.]
MTLDFSSQAIARINLIAGAALLISLMPDGGRFPEKPTGVRTAIELIAKGSKVQLASACDTAGQC